MQTPMKLNGGLSHCPGRRIRLGWNTENTRFIRLSHPRNGCTLGSNGARGRCVDDPAAALQRGPISLPQESP